MAKNNTPSRVSKHWEYNPTNDVESFDISTLTPENLVNQILKITYKDVTRTFMMKLFGSFNGKTFVHHYDTFTVPAKAFQFTRKNKLVSNQEPFTTTFGIWVFNIYFLRDLGFSELFGGYLNENVTNDIFEDINQQLVYGLLEDKVEVEQYKKFLDRTQFFMPFETILSPNHTEKILACSKEIDKLKAKLIKENQEAIDRGDEVVAKDIEDQLLAFALEYLKDDPSLDTYLSGAGANLKNNFKNLYVMKGAIRNPDPEAKQKFNIATSSYIDGISADEYSLLANSLAGGPYARSKKTELGGYWEKLIESAYNTVKMDDPGSDCGTDKYIEAVLTKKNLTMFMYSYMIKNDGRLEELTSENYEKYLGKKIKFRYSGFCKSKTGICNCCAGNFFLRRGNRNIGLATAQIPTVLKLKSMKSFHDSTIGVTQIDPMKAFGLV